jgi:hypothetical protein
MKVTPPESDDSKKSLVRGIDLRALFPKEPPLSTVVSSNVSNAKVRLRGRF